MSPEDEALVQGCLRGDAEAQRTFVARFGPAIDAVARRFSRKISADDARQLVLARLLVGEAGATSRLASFRGEGSLAGFVRVVAARVLVNALEKKTEDVLAESMFELATASGSPEDALRDAEGRDRMKRAFEAAVAELDERDRALLRYTLIDGASIDALGSLYGVHRATAARWLEAAKESLGRAMRRALVDAGALPRDRADAVHASVVSRVDLSLARVLGPREAEVPTARGGEGA
jgi:RNA polymerase sigma-70 factor (ECF subfamily)